MIMNCLLVGAGGAARAILRYFICCFAIGILAVILAEKMVGK